MGIKQLTSNTQISGYLQKRISQCEDNLVRVLDATGNACVKAGQDGGDYMDQTGNLISSIGYVVIKSGKIVRTGGFKAVKGGADGAKSGSAYALQLARECTRGIVLIVVAGMKYAAYVAAQGFNVLDSAELIAEKLVPQLMTQLGFTKR